MPGAAACCTRRADAHGSVTNGTTRPLSRADPFGETQPGRGRCQRRHHRPTTVRCELARGGHFDRPGGPPAIRSGRSRVPQSSRLCRTDPAGRRDAETRHARDQPSRPDDRPPRVTRSFGRAHAGDTRSSRRASRRVGESTAEGLVPEPVTPNRTSTALRRGGCAACDVKQGSDDTLRDSHGLRAGVVAGAGTRERVLELWERLAPFGERARQAAESAAGCASGMHGRARRPCGPRWLGNQLPGERKALGDGRVLESRWSLGNQ